MAERVRVREITNDEGNRLLRIVRRDSGSVVTWRRAQIVLLSAQGMEAPQIAEVTFTSADRVRDVADEQRGLGEAVSEYGHRRTTSEGRRLALLYRFSLHDKGTLWGLSSAPVECKKVQSSRCSTY